MKHNVRGGSITPKNSKFFSSVISYLSIIKTSKYQLVFKKKIFENHNLMGQISNPGQISDPGQIFDPLPT